MVKLTHGRATSKIMALSAFALVAACSTADEVAPPAQISEGPAIWQVADKDTTVYIFGTAEALPPDTDWRSDAVTAAFAASDRIIIETDESPEAQAKLGPVIQSLGLYQDGRTLTGALTEAQQQEVGAVTQSLGAPLAALNRLKPWLAGIQIGALNAQRQGYQTWSSGLSAMLADAKAADKPVTFLEESRVVLLTTISNLPEETHVNMLVSAAQQTRDKPTQAADIVPFYLAGDVDVLAQRYHGEGQWADQLLYDTLLVERNQEWAGKIADLLENENGTILFAIGTGHVLGPDSLQNMLEEQGISVQRQ